MGSVCSPWACNAWCVLVIVTGVTASHMPIGWLIALKKGFLHRDISIGNALMLDPPVKMEPFAEEALEQCMARLCLQEKTELAGYVALLKEMIEKLGSQDMCRGFFIDGDMAASLKDCFTQRHVREKSVGTPNCTEELG